MEFKKEHYLYLALALPLFMIAVVMLGVRFSQVELLPQFNFIYAINSGGNYSCQTVLEYQLHPESFPAHYQPRDNPDCSSVNLYLYDFKNGSNTPLSLDQARKYIFFSGPKQIQSPDGYTIQSFCATGNGPAWWWSPEAMGSSACLRKGDQQQRLNIKKVRSTGFSYPQFIFLGWIQGKKS